MQVELTDDPHAFLSPRLDLARRGRSRGLVLPHARVPRRRGGRSSARRTAWTSPSPRRPATPAVPPAPSRSRDELLSFLGGFDVTDYMGPVGLPGAEEAAAKAHRRGDRRASTAGSAPTWRGCPWTAGGCPRWPAPSRPPACGCERGEDGVTPCSTCPADVEGLRGDALTRSIATRCVARPAGWSATRGRSGWSTPPRENLEGHLDRFIELAPLERGPEGQVHGRRDGDVLPPPGPRLVRARARSG